MDLNLIGLGILIKQGNLHTETHTDRNKHHGNMKAEMRVKFP